MRVKILSRRVNKRSTTTDVRMMMVDALRLSTLQLNWYICNFSLPKYFLASNMQHLYGVTRCWRKKTSFLAGHNC